MLFYITRANALPLLRAVTFQKQTSPCREKRMNTRYAHILPALRLLLIVLTTFFCSAPLHAQQPLSSDEPIHIEADRMVSNQKENSVTFSGNVQALQGKLTINSDQMTVHYARPENNGTSPDAKNQQIKNIFAKGNVEVLQDELVATGNEVEFLADKKQIILTGNTKVWQNNNLVTGEKVLLNLATETTIIEPDTKSGGRVKAFFYPDSSKK